MIKTLTKHGNSYAMVIDKPILELLHTTPETPFEIISDGRSLVLTPVRDEAFADLIESMSAAKLVRMASIPTLLPCFRFDDAQLARLMAGEGRDAASAGLHAAILAAGKAAADAR